MVPNSTIFTLTSVMWYVDTTFVVISAFSVALKIIVTVFIIACIYKCFKQFAECVFRK